ncbi:GspH/FimT family pseudopilin [Alteromonas sp. ASW11-36]|uniref:Type II secretion system protein H n=1 Tax=Alteromonas arenosi TaxID=3055817 RepID=A0ABT7SZI3_9ALTE|nr:GspH/FimT family pseudopilin [Alteromonas sp. ASW11-36]MDM7861590.1 GspH/FimT family pseudopilin [Alteromonas sp. ASW11-36]
MKRLMVRLSSAGVSLIELLISVCIVTVVVTTAAPNLTLFIQRQRTIAELNELSYAIRMARHLAIDTQRQISLCPAADFVHCDHSNWSVAKIIFHDRNNNRQRDANEELLYGSMPARTGIDISGPKRIVAFYGDGASSTPATFRLCPSKSQAKLERAIVISLQGRVRLSRDYNHDEVHELRPGIGIGCV